MKYKNTINIHKAMYYMIANVIKPIHSFSLVSHTNAFANSTFVMGKRSQSQPVLLGLPNIENGTLSTRKILLK